LAEAIADAFSGTRSAISMGVKKFKRRGGDSDEERNRSTGLGRNDGGLVYRVPDRGLIVFDRMDFDRLKHCASNRTKAKEDIP